MGYKHLIPEKDISFVHVWFWIPMPKSWSEIKRKEMNGKPHRQTPDIDNLLKGFFDIMLPDGDQGIAEVWAEKGWAKEGVIEWTMDGKWR